MNLQPTMTSSIAHIYAKKEVFRDMWKEEVRTEIGERIPDHILDPYFDTNFEEQMIEFSNSVKGTKFIFGAMDFVYNTFKEDKIIVENGVFFQNSRKQVAPTVEAEIFLFKERKKVKKKGNYFLTEGNDPILGAIYDNLQKNIKILMNIYYGVLTNPFSKFYNRDLGDSITIRGRSSISVSALSVEGAFAKAIPKKLDALLSYWNECIKSPIDQDILEELMSFEYTWKDIVSEFNLTNHYAYNLLEHRLSRLSPKEVAKIIFKNNFKLFSKLDCFQREVYNLFSMCVKKNIPYLDPNELPFEEAHEPMERIKNVVRQVLVGMYWYGGDYIMEKSKFVSSPQDKISTIDRYTIPIIDTDSNFLSYETEFFTLWDIINRRHDKSFDIGGNPEEDKIFYTVSNMCATIMTEVIDYALDRYKAHVNILPEKFDCLKLKNEFLYVKLLVTSRKKNYLGLITLKEGKAYPQPKLDIKGLVFTKSSVNRTIGENVKTMVNDVMRKPKLDLSSTLYDLRNRTNTIVNDHKTQKVMDYCVTLKIRTSMENTDTSDYRYKAISLWNAVCENDSELINPPAAFYSIPIDIVKSNLETQFPVQYGKIVSWLNKRNEDMIKTQIFNILEKADKESDKYLFFKFIVQNFDVKDIHSSTDWINMRTKAMALKKEQKLKIKAHDVNYLTLQDIDRIAFPLTLEVIPDFILEIVNPTNSEVLISNLISPVLQELHLICPRNHTDKRLVTNILDIY